MNYGYNKSTKGYKPAREVKLANELRAIVGAFGEKLPDHKQPYIENGGLYGGVRVRKITYLTESEVADLTSKCDAAYDRVMEVCMEPRVETEAP